MSDDEHEDGEPRPDNLVLRRLDELRREAQLGRAEVLAELRILRRDVSELNVQMRSLHADMGEMRSGVFAAREEARALALRTEILEGREPS